MSTTISNPVSFSTANTDNVVSGLEDALMKSIGQGIQSGQSTDTAGLQQEMQLLTELLNQSNNAEGASNPTSSSDPSTGSSDPSASSNPSATTTPSSTSSSGNNNGIDRTQSKLERALERNVTNRLQDGQSPSDGNALQQEMHLLIELLGQNA